MSVPSLLTMLQRTLRSIPAPWGRFTRLERSAPSVSVVFTPPAQEALPVIQFARSPCRSVQSPALSLPVPPLSSFAVERAALLRAGFAVREKPCVIPAEPGVWWYPKERQQGVSLLCSLEFIRQQEAKEKEKLLLPGAGEVLRRKSPPVPLAELRAALHRFGFPLLRREEEKKEARYFMNIFASLPHIIREDGGRRESIPVLRSKQIHPSRHIAQGQRPREVLMEELRKAHWKSPAFSAKGA